MSQILSQEDLLQLKQAIMEELEIINGEIPGDEIQQLLLGFASKRGDFSIFEEQLVRKIITGDENGKLPSERLREQIIKNNYLINNLNVQPDIKRNSKGAIFFDKKNQQPIFLTVDRSNLRFKKSKVKYTFDINFSEFLINVNNTDELIDQLKDQIENLKNKVSILESDKETIRVALKSVELDNIDFKQSISELENLLQQTTSDIQDLEVSTQDEINLIQQEAQQLILDANTKLTEKEAEFSLFKNKVDIIFTVSRTYEEIVENFKKIGIGA
jgi:hypothetical protein